MDSLDSREIVVILETLVSQEVLDPEVRLVSLALLVHRAVRVNREIPDSRVSRALEVLMVFKALQEELALPVPLEWLDSVAFRVSRVTPEPLVYQVVLVSKVRLEIPVLPVAQVSLEQEAMVDHKASQA